MVARAQIKIRLGKKEDLKELIELDKESNREIHWWTSMKKSEFLELIREKRIFVAEEKKKIIGYISSEIRNKKIILDAIYVRKDFRNKKVANMLIKKFLSGLKKSKYKEVRLNCPERLRKFYEKFGFEKIRIIMRKKIR